MNDPLLNIRLYFIIEFPEILQNVFKIGNNQNFKKSVSPDNLPLI